MSAMQIADLIGKPYAAGGRGPAAYDCFGLFAELCRRRGLDVPPEQSPVQTECQASAIAGAVERGEWQRLAAPEPGCAVVMRIRPPFVTHIGMVLDNCTDFIHIHAATRVCIERLYDARWVQRIAGYYRHA